MCMCRICLTCDASGGTVDSLDDWVTCVLCAYNPTILSPHISRPIYSTAAHSQQKVFLSLGPKQHTVSAVRDLYSVLVFS